MVYNKIFIFLILGLSVSNITNYIEYKSEELINQWGGDPSLVSWWN